MKKNLSFLFILLVNVSFSQIAASDYNFDFEKTESNNDLPTDWIKWGNYDLKIDETQAVSGKNSVVIDGTNGESFGGIAYSLPANYKGKKITLEGFIKYEGVTDGFVGLLMRIDKGRETVGFENMESQGLQGTSDWKKYSITLNFAKGADNINIAGMLVGKGKVWFDNFKVTIDGKPIESLVPIQKELSIVEKDNEFDSGSKFEITTLNEIQKRNLFVLGKVWGFAKYHHPAIAKETVSWDYELFRIMPKIDNKDFDNELVQWINKLGPFKTENKKLPKESEIKLLPNTKWIADTNFISAELSTLLQKLNKATRSTTNYYIDLNPDVKNPIFQNENPYEKMEYTDAGFKLLAVFRYWNMIEYFYPNRHLMDENWDDVLKEFIPKISTTKDKKEYTLTVLELIGKIQDTHANVWGFNEVLERYFGKNIVPVELKFVENKAVVVKLQDEFKEANLQVGDVILKVNGVKVEDWIKNNLKYFPASNYPTQLRDVATKMLRSNENSINLTVENTSGIKDVVVSTIKYQYFDFQPISH